MKLLVTPRGSDKSAGDWFNVFNDCDVLGPTNVPLDQIPPNFQVDSKIDKPGGVHVTFTGIVYGMPEVSVVVQLIGTTPFEDPFLPVIQLRHQDSAPDFHRLRINDEIEFPILFRVVTDRAILNGAGSQSVADIIGNDISCGLCRI